MNNSLNEPMNENQARSIWQIIQLRKTMFPRLLNPLSEDYDIEMFIESYIELLRRYEALALKDTSHE